MSSSSCTIPTASYNIEGEVGKYSKKMTYEQVHDDAKNVCQSIYTPSKGQSAAEQGGRWADAGRAFASGCANLAGVGGMVYKGLSTAMGGSPNYTDAPTELTKQLKDKLRETRDNMFYHVICDQSKLNSMVMANAKALDSLISEEMIELDDLLKFEVQSIGLLELTLATMLCTIIIYMLLLEPKKN